MGKHGVKILINVALLVVSFCFGNRAGISVTNYSTKKNAPFVFDVTEIKRGLSLPVKEKQEMLVLPQKHIELRVKKSVDDETVEPLYLRLENDPIYINKLSAQIAKPGQVELLARTLKERLDKIGATVNTNDDSKQNENQNTNQNYVKSKDIRITEDLLAMMEPKSVGIVFEKSHMKLTLTEGALRKNKALRRSLLKQLRPFLSSNEYKHLLKKVKDGSRLVVDEDLLPRFAKKMVRKYTIYRGPNCFHSSLAFQSPLLPSSSLVNVKIEQGYHRSMINYDELWRVLNLNFYEIDPRESPLQYGDTIVFFDVPEGADLSNPDFKWMRHAASYLFGNYTFSKGSKSPNTPYSVKTLDEEWQTWQRFSKKVAVKIYRRSTKEASKRPVKTLVDWLY